MASDGGTTPFVSRLNSQGGTTWSQALSANNGSPSYLGFDGSGRVWALGFGLEPITYPNEPTHGHSWLALLGPDGGVLWQQQFGDAGSFIVPTGLTLTNDGHAVIALRVNQGSLSIADPQTGPIANHALVTAFNADGTRAWSRGIGQVQEDNINALVAAPDGNLYAAGSTVRSVLGSVTTVDLFLVELAEDGTVRWRQTYLQGGDGEDPILAARPCGGLVIAAGTHNGGTSGTLLIDVDGAGQQRRIRNVSNGYVYPGAIAAHGSDGILLVGQFREDFTFDSVQLSGTQGSAFVARYLE
jgi:hypothetical protein